MHNRFPSIIRGLAAGAALIAISARAAPALSETCHFLECEKGSERAPPPPAIPARPAPNFSPLSPRAATIMPASPTQSCASFNDSTFCVSSALPPQYGFAYGPVNLTDGRLETAWSPAGSADGIGEWILVKFASPRNLSAINMLNGYHKSRSIFQQNSRLRLYEIRTSSGWSATGELSDDEAAQSIYIGDASRVEWVQLVIRSVYPGSRYRDVAITELRAIDR